MTIPSIYYTAIRRNPFIAAYWRLNDAEESPTAIDWGNKYLLNGFYNYNPTKSVSIINNDIFAASRLFSKSEQNVEIPNSTPLENVTTLEAWVVPFEAGQTSCIICKMNSENTKPEPYYLGLKSGKLYYAIGNGAEELVVESKETLAAYGAYYVCGLFDNRRKVTKIFVEVFSFYIRNNRVLKRLLHH